MMMRTDSSKFTHHTACEACGSSDAKAHYTNGGTHCFSCKKTTRPTMSGYVQELTKSFCNPIISLPHDIGNEYSEECLKWVGQYHLDAVDLIRSHVKWSPSRQQLLFIYQNMTGAGIGLLQGRNFGVNRPKYFNLGNIEDVLPVYKYTEVAPANTLVIVEDAISAIKVSRYGFVDAMPLLGCAISLRRLTEVQKLGYKHVVFWLDHDKYKEALRLSGQMKYLGPNSSVVTSDLDPKCYTGAEILDKLDFTWTHTK